MILMSTFRLRTFYDFMILGHFSACALGQSPLEALRLGRKDVDRDAAR